MLLHLKFMVDLQWTFKSNFTPSYLFDLYYWYWIKKYSLSGVYGLWELRSLLRFPSRKVMIMTINNNIVTYLYFTCDFYTFRLLQIRFNVLYELISQNVFVEKTKIQQLAHNSHFFFFHNRHYHRRR